MVLPTVFRIIYLSSYHLLLLLMLPGCLHKQLLGYAKTNHILSFKLCYMLKLHKN